MVDPEIQTFISDQIAQALAFSQQKYGDTPTDAQQLTPKKYVDGVASVLNASIVGTITSIAAITVGEGLWGDASDGAGNADGTTVVAGATPSSGVYTFTRDVFLSNLTVASNASIFTGGYQVFVQGTTTINGPIAWNGISGGPGSDGTVFPPTGGGGGSVLSGGTLASTLGGTRGSNGGLSVSGGNGNPGQTPSVGAGFSHSLGASGATGATGGNGGVGAAHSAGGGAGGAVGGVVVAALNPPDTLTGVLLHGDFLDTYYQHQGSGSSGGSGGGGSGGGDVGGSSGAGGGAGGSGGNGGIIALYSNKIVNNITGGLQAKGGSGGKGGNGNNASGGNQQGGGGGGAGGAGGSGGVIIAMYTTLVQNGTFDVAGGTGGALGTSGSGVGGGSNGSNGTAGPIGNAGKVWQFQIK